MNASPRDSRRHLRVAAFEAGIDAVIADRKTTWWSQLSPLTKDERAQVIQDVHEVVEQLHGKPTD